MRRVTTVSEPREPHELVAAEVRAEMARQRITQTEMARRLGTNQAFINRRLVGEVPFNITTLAKIGDVLGVPVTHFMPPVKAVS